MAFNKLFPLLGFPVTHFRITLVTFEVEVITRLEYELPELHMFARAKIASEADLTVFEAREPIVAVRHIRRLRKASLVECSDESFYIVKQNDTRQSPNALANEFLGTVLATAVGLPVPGIRPILMTEKFFTCNPDAALKDPSGRFSSEPGIHFGSCFVGDPNDASRLLELLMISHIRRIANRECFLGMYLLDIAANQQRQRQALFIRDTDAFCLRTVFINHGHMFGGPTWDGSPHDCRPSSRIRSIYLSLWDEDDVSSWIVKLKSRLPWEFTRAMPCLPRAWFSGDISRVRDTFLQRLDRLPELAQRYRLLESRDNSNHYIRSSSMQTQPEC